MRFDDEPKEGFELLVCGAGGNPAHCVYLNNHRLVGGKPWGGGRTTASWRFTLSDLRQALPELEINKRKVVCAAPDLLAALKALAAISDRSPEAERAFAAIAKAEGR